MLPARMMRVVFSMLISSTFIGVALGVACEDNWPHYCPNNYNAQHDNCKFDDFIRTNCRVTCGLCPRRTTPSPTSTVITSVPSSTTTTARAKITSPPTTSRATILHCEDGKFGISCEYTCHCKDGAVCDKNTGSCPSECDSRWCGEACQIGNAAYNKTAITKRTSVENIFDARRAVDPHDSSCVYMDSENRDQYKWFMVDLEHRHVVFNLTIVTRDCYQCQANIFIKDDTNIPSTRDEFCNSLHVHNQRAESNEVVCNKPVIGRYLFMELRYSDGPMHLCDVRVHAYQYKDCPYSEYGPNCNLKCQCKDATEQCDVITGNCPVSGCNMLNSGEDCQSVAITSTTSTALTTTVKSTTTELPTTVEHTIVASFTVVKRRDNVMTVTWTGLPRSYTKLQVRYCTRDTTPICGYHLIADQNALEASFVVNKFVYEKQKSVVCYLEVYDASGLVYLSPPVESPNEVEEPINWMMLGIGGAVVLLLVVLVGVGVLLWRRMVCVLGAGDGDVGVSVPEANPVEPLYLNQAFERAESQVDPVYYNVPKGKQTEDADEEPYEEIPETPYASLDNVPGVVANQPYANLRPSGD